MSEKPRWIYRFDNYKRAFHLLRAGVELSDQRPLTDLEKEGLIQRFEYTWELAWKVLRDYLESTGIVLETVTPASTIKAAFVAKIVVTDGEAWRRALDARNRISHVYNMQAFEKVISEVKREYLPLFDDLHMYLLEQSMRGGHGS